MQYLRFDAVPQGQVALHAATPYTQHKLHYLSEITGASVEFDPFMDMAFLFQYPQHVEEGTP
jgi:hypothetical protein